MPWRNGKCSHPLASPNANNKKIRSFCSKNSSKLPLNDYVNIIRAAGIIRRTLWPDNLLKCSKFLVAAGSVGLLYAAFFFATTATTNSAAAAAAVRLSFGWLLAE